VTVTLLRARMSSVERAGPWEIPREVAIRAFWGNVELDLREATFASGVTTFDVHVTMGNVELTVPPHVEVRLEIDSFAASVEQEGADRAGTSAATAARARETSDATEDANSDAAPVLRIVGRAKFANVEVLRMWPGETRRDAARRKRDHRHDWHGHGHGHGHLDALDGWDDPLHDRLGRDTEHVRSGEHDPERFGLGDHDGHRARRRARHAERRRRWRELHAERDLWRRSRDRGQPWRPWWLMARMRRRIFFWLAFALGGGIAIGWRISEAPRWWWVAIGLIVLSMVSGAIAFRLTRPLIMVVKAARDIGDGKLDTRLDVDRHGGETRVLATAINDMAEKIEQQIADQRQLLAAVSHELRTPLGHMRVLVETARGVAPHDPTATGPATREATGSPTGATTAPVTTTGPSTTTPSTAAPATTANGRATGEATEALDEIEREILVLDDLVGKLLASSRLEFGNLDRRPLDLGELVSDVATSAGIDPDAIEAVGNTRASVDPTLVRRALANLLDNARVHGNGVVAVRIERRAGQIAIEVDDAGPGVSAERRADAFRAFGPSAGTAGGGSGLGLGLALVSRIAVAHGGGAWISERPGGGARVGFGVKA